MGQAASSRSQDRGWGRLIVPGHRTEDGAGC
jgi:hypothetical protein